MRLLRLFLKNKINSIIIIIIQTETNIITIIIIRIIQIKSNIIIIIIEIENSTRTAESILYKDLQVYLVPLIIIIINLYLEIIRIAQFNQANGILF